VHAAIAFLSVNYFTLPRYARSISFVTHLSFRCISTSINFKDEMLLLMVLANPGAQLAQFYDLALHTATAQPVRNQ
jgi:hypothetical protein